MEYLCQAFDAPRPCPPEMLGSMAAVPLLPPPGSESRTAPTLDPIQDALFHDYRIEVPVVWWPPAGRRLVRVSAQAYNRKEDYVYLAESLKEVLRRRA